MENKIIFIIYLAALSAFAPSATDMYLASMPTITHVFNTTASMVQLTLSLFFLGFAIMQLFWGPLSDKIGRKAVIFFGIALFIIGCLLCVFSQSILMLIIARVIQSIGACAGIVMAMAIIKDTFSDTKDIARAISSVMAAAIAAPMVSPIIGSYLLIHFNWQATFYFLAIYGAILFLCTFKLKESHIKERRKPLKTTELIGAYIEQIKHLPFLFSALSVGTGFSIMFAFIASSSFIYIKIYHLPIHIFAYLFTINAASLIIGTLAANKLKKQLRSEIVLFIGFIILFFGVISILIALTLFSSTALSVVIPSFFVTLGVAFVYPEMTAQALENVVAYNGLASSLIGSVRFIVAAIIGYVMGVVIHQSALPLAAVMMTLSLLTLIFVILYFGFTKKALVPQQEKKVRL